jgi:hypothetical protein
MSNLVSKNSRGTQSDIDAGAAIVNKSNVDKIIELKKQSYR